jgi:hypothetical protein
VSRPALPHVAAGIEAAATLNAHTAAAADDNAKTQPPGPGVAAQRRLDRLFDSVVPAAENAKGKSGGAAGAASAPRTRLGDITNNTMRGGVADGR